MINIILYHREIFQPNPGWGRNGKKGKGEKHGYKLLQNPFFVILNEVKDLELVERTRFFAPLRMTRSQGLGFCNSFYFPLRLLSLSPFSPNFAMVRLLFQADGPRSRGAHFTNHGCGGYPLVVKAG
jgi:hypothetical protein